MRLGVGAIALLAAIAAAPSAAAPAAIAEPSGKVAPSYDAFGFAFASGGSVYSVARRGSTHQQDPGRLALFRHTSTGTAALIDPISFPFTGDPGLDNRNVAGGVGQDGCLHSFYASKTVGSGWVRLVATRTAPPGSAAACPASIGEVPTGGDVVFSPYGPMVTLPSGKRLQTFYGYSTTTPSRVRVLSSSDGVTWGGEVEVDRGWDIRPTEAAMVRLDGTTDATTKLLMVVRSQRTTPQGATVHALRQYTSVDGGRRWSKLGEIPATISPYSVVPWIAAVEGHRVAMVWADRATLTLRSSIAAWSEVFSRPDAWPEAVVLHTSRLAALEPARRSVGDFGYPSIAFRDPAHPVVVFYDATLDPVATALGVADTALFEIPLE